MQIRQSRRDFLTSLSAASAAGILGARTSLAAEPPPETTTLRLRYDPGICIAPWFIAAALLRAEGFTDVRYVPVPAGATGTQMIASGEVDFALSDPATTVFRLDTDVPITVLAGMHVGCFELFAHEPIHSISDLKGKRVGIDFLGTGKHRYVAIMAAYIGLDPHKDINWITGPRGDFMERFAAGKVDAFLATPPESLEMRARKVGRVILNSTEDRPWSQYFCCMLAGNRDFIREHPVATKRVLRAAFKATDLCASDPQRVSQQLVDRGFAQRYDYALQTLTELPSGSWREFDPEDSMRFYALRMHEVGFITSSPNTAIENGTDWRFLNELKSELKA